VRVDTTASRYRRTPTKDETAPVVEWDAFPHTHAVRLWLVGWALKQQADKLPPETISTLRARLPEVDPERMANALKVMRSKDEQAHTT
jgi:hypothetical protein